MLGLFLTDLEFAKMLTYGLAVNNHYFSDIAGDLVSYVLIFDFINRYSSLFYIVIAFFGFVPGRLLLWGLFDLNVRLREKHVELLLS